MSTAVKEEQNKNSQHQEYDSYRKIRNQFVSKIPSHWSDASLIHVSEMNPSDNEIPDYKRDQEATFLPMEAVGIGEIHEREETKTIEDAADGYTYFRENDILLATITPCFENGKLAIATDLKNDIGFGSTEFSVISPNSTLKDRYLFYYLQSQEFKEAGTASMRGAAGQKRVPEKFLRAHKIPLPSQKEQKAIVHFLDQETEKIDRLIEQKERLIELLEEKREALITRAVTKGLDPDAEMKDSGVEWLGEIPKNWDLASLNYVSLMNPSDSEIAEVNNDQKASFLPMESVGIGEINDRSKTRKIQDMSDGYTYFSEGDIVLATITPCFENGKLAIATGLKNNIGFGSTELSVVRPESLLESKFLYYYLQSSKFKNAGTASMRGAAGQKRVPEKFLRSCKVPIPSQKEQIEIVEYLGTEIGRIKSFIENIEDSISLLRTYRKSLVSHAVTGKIDVREEVDVN